MYVGNLLAATNDDLFHCHSAMKGLGISAKQVAQQLSSIVERLSGQALSLLFNKCRLQARFEHCQREQQQREREHLERLEREQQTRREKLKQEQQTRSEKLEQEQQVHREQCARERQVQRESRARFESSMQTLIASIPKLERAIDVSVGVRQSLSTVEIDEDTDNAIANTSCRPFTVHDDESAPILDDNAPVMMFRVLKLTILSLILLCLWLLLTAT